jgi:chorismate--pyruvate lyase
MKKGMPLWRQQRYIPRGLIPPPMMPWLFDAASLTQRLRQVCQGRFQVRVVSQRRVRPLRDERVALRMRDHEHALVRMVYLLCDGQPWVFARTVIPLRTLGGAQRRLARLGSKPLGEMLFADRSMRRSAVEVARLLPGDKLFGLIATGGAVGSLWGRRSVFYLQNKPLLVSEIFLPAINPTLSLKRRLNQ